MAYTFWKKITIDPTKVPNTDQVNYPVLFSRTDPNLASVANGGHVQNVSTPVPDIPFDLIFALDACGTQPLAFERERWVATTGECVMWVKLPVVSHTVPTVFYVVYGNAAVVTDQSNPHAVWDANHLLVTHQGNNGIGGLANHVDSTVNNHSTATATVTTASGQIDGGIANSGNQALAYTESDFPFAGSSRTLECWALFSSFANYNMLMQYGNRNVASESQNIFVNLGGSGLVYAGTYLSGNALNAAQVFGLSTWYYIAVSYDGTTAKAYINGVLIASSALSWNTVDDGQGFQISRDNQIFAPSLNGKMDEIRVSNSVRSPDWLAANYNNQFSPSTFYSVSAETSGDCTGGIAPSCNLFIQSIVSGFVTLAWTTTGTPTSASIDNGIGAVNPAGGSVTIALPLITTTYHLTVTNTAGSSACQVTVVIPPATPAVSVPAVLEFVALAGNGTTPGLVAGFGNVYTTPALPNGAPVLLTDDDYGEIFPYYITYFFVNHEQEMALQLGAHRKMLSYFTALINGTGNITITALMNVITNAWPLNVTRALATQAVFDLEWAGGSATAQRMAFKFASSPVTGTDNGFQLEKCVATLKPVTHLPVRGSAQ